MINRVFNRLGYSIQNNQEISRFPYKKRYNFLDTEFDFWIPDSTGKQWYDHNFWEQAVELITIKEMLDANDSIIEFGVHYGFLAVFICKNLNEFGKYLGVELLPKAALYSQAQLSLNNLNSTCRVINAAGAETNKKIYCRYDDGGNAFIKRSNDESLIVDAITGDSLLEEQGKVDFLKIDVEGYEVQVLEGCKEILKSLPKIAIELHLESITQYQRVVDDVFKIIPIENYEGKYFWNSGGDYIRPDSHKLTNFDLNKFPKDGIVNLFLTPKS